MVHAVFWLLALFPAASLALRGGEEAWSAWWLGRAAGLVGLSLLALLVPLGSRLRFLDRRIGLDGAMKLHRKAAMLGSLLLLVHPALFALDGLDLSGPLPASLRSGQAALVLLLLVLLAIPLHRWLRIDYRHWRLAHTGAILVVAVGFWHAFAAGSSLADLPEIRAHAILLAAAAFAAFLWNHAVAPFRRRRFIVESVEPDGPATRLRLRTEDGRPFVHAPGQFAFLRLHSALVRAEEHPFSLVSAAGADGRVEFGIKALGDWTREVGRAKAGETALLEGPFGVFGRDLSGPPALLFVAGGIGLTPLLSMLRSLELARDPRPAVLVCADRNENSLLFEDELARLTPPRRVVRVLSAPAGNWPGERGRIDAPLLARCTEGFPPGAHAWLCGPAGLMDSARRALRSLGWERRRIHAEEFRL